MVSRLFAQGASLLVLCAGLATDGGCAQTPRTEVILVVDTDIRGPEGLDSIQVSVRDPDGADMQRASATLGSGQPSLPRTLGLVLEGDRPRLGPYTATVTGNRLGVPLIARTLRFDFQRGRTLSILVELLASCRGVTCGADQTCAEGGCRSVQLTPEELSAWDGHPMSRLDAGPLTPTDAGPPRDAGAPRDAGTPSDAGPRDAATSMDAGSPADAGSRTDAARPSPDSGFSFPDAAFPDAFFAFPDAFRDRRDAGR